MRLFHVFVFVATISLLNYARPSAAQEVCNEKPEPHCNARSRFRTLDGTCNNLERPFLGAAETAFRRLLPPDYADGKSEPRKGRRGVNDKILVPLPNCRNVSLAVFKDIAARSPTLTHMAMVFGQFLAHDITLGGQPEEITCDGSCQPVNECFGIPANKTGDPAFPGADGVNCIILRRNRPCNEDVPRQQENILTSFIDASHIYGNNKQESNDVRDLSNGAGLLRTMPQNITSLEDLLPKANPHTPCRTSDSKNRPCFLTGDFRRNNENQGLNAMHTIWVREHNRIALKLGQINPSWCGDEIFEETRRIIGAMMQHITFNEWLPAIIGKANMDKFNLTLLDRGRFREYDPSVDPSIPNSLATAALRLGHSLIRNLLSRWGKKLQSFPPIPIKEFLNPEFLYETENGGVDSILRGLAKDKANDIDGFIATAVLKYHLGEGGPDGPSRGDLMAINCQRGRDHGLPGYNQFRTQVANLSPLSFGNSDLTIPFPSLSKIEAVYKNVDDVDLWVGGIHEKPIDAGSQLGPTFVNIVGKAFRDLRFGDRFWYETDQLPVRFTFRQLRELRKASLARIICDNSDGIHQIQPKALLQKSFVNDASTECSDLPFVGLQEWKVQEGPILH